MTGLSQLQRYRCPYAGWAGDVLILIDEDDGERPGSIGKLVWRRPDPKWLAPIRRGGRAP